MNPYKSLMSLFSILLFFFCSVWQSYLLKVTYKVKLRLKPVMYNIKLMVLPICCMHDFSCTCYCSNYYHFGYAVFGNLLIHCSRIRNQIHLLPPEYVCAFLFHFAEYPYIFHFLTVMIILNAVIIKQYILLTTIF